VKNQATSVSMWIATAAWANLLISPPPAVEKRIFIEHQ